MMACFAHNDISMLLNFYFWQPVYYLLDPEDQSFGVKSKEKRDRWASVDEKIGESFFCSKCVGKLGTFDWSFRLIFLLLTHFPLFFFVLCFRF